MSKVSIEKVVRLNILAMAMFVSACGVAAAGTVETNLLVEYKGLQGWRLYQIGGVTNTEEGTAFLGLGDDPFVVGPVLPLELMEAPEKEPLIFVLRLKTSKGSDGQLFYGSKPEEKNSQHFQISSDNQFHDYTLQVPPLSVGSMFRLDFTPQGGNVVVASIRVLTKRPNKIWRYNDPVRPQLSTKADAVVRAGKIELNLWSEHGGYFEVAVAGTRMACGYISDQLAIADMPRLDLRVSVAKTTVQATPEGATMTLRLTDGDGGQWTLTRTFKPLAEKDAIEADFSLVCDQPRKVLHVPVFTMLPGLGSFETNKTQAVFCGVEYLENEPSSSEKDIRGPLSKRLIPDPLKITMPLMALAHEGRYVGLIWKPTAQVSAIFDSPNRTLGNGGHLMGLVAPAPPTDRKENQLVADTPIAISPDKPLLASYTLIGGLGDSMVSAFRQYVKIRGLPPVPKVDRAVVERTLAGGWLDSKIYADGKYRHAAGAQWAPQPAADTAVFMKRLTQSIEDPALRDRLKERATSAAAFLGPDGNIHTVGHVITGQPAIPLVLGQVRAAYARIATNAAGAVKAFDADGNLHCTSKYREGHWSDQANGFTASTLCSLTAAAAVSADTNLIAQVIRLTKALNQFDNTVPRGAQTWEIPLHTPDILASARLVSVYLDAYELSGDRAMLDRAIYWGWTGLPFIYLHPPVPGVGVYGTIPVYGGTGWGRPFWIGLPVQWCGLVYSDAIYRLADYDPAGPWLKLAQGITACGFQMSWPPENKDLQGLLPDFYHLREQKSDGPPINPGTVGANLPGLFGEPPYYRFKRLKTGAIVHAPGFIKIVKDDTAQTTATIDAWPQSVFWVAVAGVANQPKVTIGGQPVPAEAIEYDAGMKLLVVRMEKSGTIDLGWVSP